MRRLPRLFPALAATVIALSACGSSDTTTADSEPISPESEASGTGAPLAVESGDELSPEAEDVEASRLLAGRADVAVSGDLVDDVLTVEVNAIDVDFLNLPEIDLTLDGFTIPMLPDDCTLTPTGASCKMPVALRSLTERQPPTESAVWTIQLTDTTPAIDSTVTVIATSEFNPLDNDPDPTNNTITLTAP